jgi:hypothetical protein
MENKTFKMTIQRDGVFMSVEKDTGDISIPYLVHSILKLVDGAGFNKNDIINHINETFISDVVKEKATASLKRHIMARKSESENDWQMGYQTALNDILFHIDNP